MNKIHFESIDSTNTYLKKNYQNLEDMTFVSASLQTQGRGRNNRIWQADDKNLLCSILLKDQKYFAYTNELSIISGYTVLQVLQEYGVNNLSIKWPNDVYVDGKKICGILLEATSSESIECLIIGIGINVNQSEFDKTFNATSMINELNKQINISELENKLYEKFIENLDKLMNHNDFYEEITKYDYLKGKQAYAIIDNQKTLVQIIGIDPDYSLKVIHNNELKNVNSGEISFNLCSI